MVIVGAVTQENVDTIRTIYRAFNERRLERGLELDTGFVHVCRLRDGLVVWGYDCAGPERSF
jgi:hypothetical protein